MITIDMWCPAFIRADTLRHRKDLRDTLDLSLSYSRGCIPRPLMTPHCSHAFPKISSLCQHRNDLGREKMGDYLALGDEAGLGGLPGGSPARDVAEGEDGALAARCWRGDWRPEERERRVEAHHGGLRGIVLRRVVGVAGEGHCESPTGGGRCQVWWMVARVCLLSPLNWAWERGFITGPGPSYLVCPVFNLFQTFSTARFGAEPSLEIWDCC